jgi:hypothetical protein
MKVGTQFALFSTDNMDKMKAQFLHHTHGSIIARLNTGDDAL